MSKCRCRGLSKAVAKLRSSKEAIDQGGPYKKQDGHHSQALGHETKLVVLFVQREHGHGSQRLQVERLFALQHGKLGVQLHLFVRKAMSCS